MLRNNLDLRLRLRRVLVGAVLLVARGSVSCGTSEGLRRGEGVESISLGRLRSSCKDDGSRDDVLELCARKEFLKRRQHHVAISIRGSATYVERHGGEGRVRRFTSARERNRAVGRLL